MLMGAFDSIKQSPTNSELQLVIEEAKSWLHRQVKVVKSSDLNFAEFTRLMVRAMVDTDSEKEMREAFRYFDTDGCAAGKSYLSPSTCYA